MRQCPHTDNPTLEGNEVSGRLFTATQRASSPLTAHLGSGTNCPGKGVAIRGVPITPSLTRFWYVS